MKTVSTSNNEYLTASFTFEYVPLAMKNAISNDYIASYTFSKHISVASIDLPTRLRCCIITMPAFIIVHHKLH